MIELTLLIFLNSLLIVGFYHATTYDGYEMHEVGATPPMEWRNIFWWVRYYGQSLPIWLQKPIFRCENCMSSFHGSYVFITYLYLNDHPIEGLYLYPFYVLALSGMNSLVGKYIS